MTDSTTALPRPIAHRWLLYLALVIGVLGLSMSAVFVRWAGAPGPVSGFYRVSLAAAVLALPALGQARRPGGLSRRHVLGGGIVLAGIWLVYRPRAGDSRPGASILVDSASD